MQVSNKELQMQEIWHTVWVVPHPLPPKELVCLRHRLVWEILLHPFTRHMSRETVLASQRHKLRDASPLTFMGYNLRRVVFTGLCDSFLLTISTSNMPFPRQLAFLTFPAMLFRFSCIYKWFTLWNVFSVPISCKARNCRGCIFMVTVH